MNLPRGVESDSTGITKNNETLLGSMKSILDSSLSDIKRANSDTADSHLREIKKLKFKEPRRFKKKANEYQYRFNLKLTDVLDEGNPRVLPKTWTRSKSH